MTALLWCVLLAGDYTAYDFLPGNPLAVPGKEDGFRYDLRPGKAAAASHPHLMVTREELAAARDRSDPPAVRAREAVRTEAEEALEYDFAPPDESWYDELKGRSFSAIYPPIYRHTALEPARTWTKVLTLARAWAVTGHRPYAERAVEVLRTWADYGFAAEHYDTGMNYAVWSILALECYDLLFDQLAARDHERLARFFGRCLRAIMRNDCFWIERGIGGGLNNHLAWHRYTAGAIALFYGEEAIVSFTLGGRRSLVELAERGLRDDGLWLEGSIPYHLTAQYPLIAAYRLYRRHGVTVPPLANGRSFQDFFRGIRRIVLPDLTLPPLGDAYGMRRYLPDSARWEVAYELWKDPVAAYMIHKRRRSLPWRDLLHPAPPPEIAQPLRLTSRLFPGHGYAVLREPQGPPEAIRWSLLTTYDAAGVHSNADKLSFMLYARGRLWLEDREAKASAVHAFSADIQRTLNRHTICHNALLVDWQDQQQVGHPLQLAGFRRGPGLARVSVADRAGDLYPSVRQIRSFVVTPEYALDVLSVRADREAELVLPLHVNGTMRATADEWQAATLPEGPPWSWLAQPKRTGAAAVMRFSFEAEGQSLHVVSAGPASGHVWSVRFPRDDRGEAYGPALLRTVTARRACFVHLFHFARHAADRSVAWTALEEDGLLSVTVTAKNGRADRYVLPDR
jgi:hypothetical protein